jgi:hypothetical protein
MNLAILEIILDRRPQLGKKRKEKKRHCTRPALFELGDDIESTPRRGRGNRTVCTEARRENTFELMIRLCIQQDVCALSIHKRKKTAPQ